MKCYNSVAKIVDKTTKQLGSAYILNKEKYDSLQKVCQGIDDFAAEINCISIDADIDSDSKQLTINIRCEDIILEDGRSSRFFTLIQMVDSFAFSKAKGSESLCIALNIDKVWEKSRGR